MEKSLVFQPYQVHFEDFHGRGFSLYFNNNLTSYYFFKREENDLWELYFNNLYFIARSDDFEKIKALTLELFSIFPVFDSQKTKKDDKYYLNQYKNFYKMQDIAQEKGFNIDFIFEGKVYPRKPMQTDEEFLEQREKTNKIIQNLYQKKD